MEKLYEYLNLGLFNFPKSGFLYHLCKMKENVDDYNVFYVAYKKNVSICQMKYFLKRNTVI